MVANAVLKRIFASVIPASRWVCLFKADPLNNDKIFLPTHLIQIAQEPLQDLLTAKATFLFRRLSSFKPNNHETLVVINSRAMWPHPYFTWKSPYTVNLMTFLEPKAAFELTNNFPRSKHLDRVYGSVFISGKFWNKSDVPAFEDCKWDSNDDVFSGYISPCWLFERILPPAFNLWPSSSAKTIALTEREINTYVARESCKCFTTECCGIENRPCTVM